MTFSAEEIRDWHLKQVEEALDQGWEADPNGAMHQQMADALTAMLEQREAVTDDDIRVACEALGIPVDGDDPFLDGTDVKRALESYASRHARQVPDETFKQVLASLVAAVSLLRRGGRRAAASDKVFSIMLNDYDKAIAAGRDAIAAAPPAPSEEVE